MACSDWYSGKTVWVTGASTGIGKEIAFKLAKTGCRLVLSATNQQKLNENRLKCIGIAHRFTVITVKLMPDKA